MQMWRMWNKRRQREKERSDGSASSQGGGGGGPTVAAAVAKADARQKLKLSFPFGRNRRDVLIDELQKLLHQSARATQTDQPMLTDKHKAVQTDVGGALWHTSVNGTPHETIMNHILPRYPPQVLEQVPEGGVWEDMADFAPDPVIYLGAVSIRDGDEMHEPMLLGHKEALEFGSQLQQTVPITPSSSLIESATNYSLNFSHPSNESRTSASHTSTSGSAFTGGGGSTQSSQTYGYLRRGRARHEQLKLKEEVDRQIDCLGGGGYGAHPSGGSRPYHWRRGRSHSPGSNSPTSVSVKSAPLPATSSFQESEHSIEHPESPVNFDPSRRWTFVETGKAPRGAPRGLVPTMFIKRQNKEASY